MLGYLYRKRFGLKIAGAIRKEGDRIGGGLPSTETGCVVKMEKLRYTCGLKVVSMPHPNLRSSRIFEVIHVQ